MACQTCAFYIETRVGFSCFRGGITPTVKFWGIREIYTYSTHAHAHTPEGVEEAKREGLERSGTLEKEDIQIEEEEEP